MIGFYQDFVEFIREGDLDDHLESLRIYIVERQQKIGQIEQNFDTAQRVRVVAKLKPNYLLGHDFPVKKRNAKTVVVAVPDTCTCERRKDAHIDDHDALRCPKGMGLYKPKYGRFAGMSHVRIPKTALEVVA